MDNDNFLGLSWLSVSVTATDIIYIALIYSQFVRFKYKPLLLTILLNTI